MRRWTWNENHSRKATQWCSGAGDDTILNVQRAEIIDGKIEEMVRNSSILEIIWPTAWDKNTRRFLLSLGRDHWTTCRHGPKAYTTTGFTNQSRGPELMACRANERLQSRSTFTGIDLCGVMWNSDPRNRFGLKMVFIAMSVINIVRRPLRTRATNSFRSTANQDS
jgi:hypothetical protein